MPSPLAALSPLDGRYARTADPLRRYFSEQALIGYRVRIELAWLEALAAERAIKELRPFSAAARKAFSKLVQAFSERDAEHIKNIEAETNHDVKAIEYWLKSKLARNREVQRSLEFVHFASTSEDINNLAYALMIAESRAEVMLPRLGQLVAALKALAHRHAALPMLSRTHGQAATPTTLGKEMANFAHRLARARRRNPRQKQRRGRQLQRARGGLSRLRLGALLPALRRAARARIQPLHDADRAARLARRAAGCVRAREQRAPRPRPRPLGVHLARLFLAESKEKRSGILDHAAQGEPDRLRELRGQCRHCQRAAAPSLGEAAGVALAARSLRFDRAAQSRSRPRTYLARLRGLPARARAPGSRPRAPGRRSRDELGSARRGGAAGDAPARRARGLREAQGDEPRQAARAPQPRAVHQETADSP